MKIFIGGPLKLRALKAEVINKLNNIIKKEYEVLIGDAGGIDKAIQTYLSNKNYKNVIVYSVNNAPRNNIGNWQNFSIETETITRNREYFTLKDRKMAETADIGFMIWNKKSQGTLNNMVNLLMLNKKVCLFLQEENKLMLLKTLEDLEFIILNENSLELKNLFDSLLKKAEKNYKNFKTKKMELDQEQLLLNIN